MRKLAHFKTSLLALMLLASHVVLISHVTAHFAPDLEQCQLCVSQAHMASAIPVSDQACPVDPGLDAPSCGVVCQASRATIAKAYHQRAPPSPSA